MGSALNTLPPPLWIRLLWFQQTLDYLYQSDTDHIILPPGNVSTQFLIPHGFCKVYVGELARFLEVKINSSLENVEVMVFILDGCSFHVAHE